MIKHNNEVSYQMAFSPSSNKLTIIRDIHGGICGPMATLPACQDRQHAERMALGLNMMRASEWKVSSLGDHWCDMVQTPLLQG